ncbi:hypothetical protein A2818_02435 [Candidatus Nomurabacteria bacterium RIFCSPHIGHO2_01_FULL_40_12]|uniref:Vitamin K epoxide reductase domain-containing protein n=1 Tax=Candidatus Nomurabacteria bacterium RIFCSPHIGHO2_01_FULL_40_12 TaxID=1801737 RepID=A0A1F6UYU1_9BACT|nr:MAG: hypothetical protein A2818_02435 [Candidatus Nomurabacteria bacterium RIFCSPHIGHO2_01_FULL_40_12]
MYFSNDILIRIMIVVLGLCGFLVARHIYTHKKNQIPLVCPIGFDCGFVVQSDYSKFLGVPIEIFGMIYYAFLSLFYLFSIFTLGNIPVILSGLLLLASLGAFLFSLYLLAVQIFVLKKGCSWCIVSAMISSLVFIFTAVNYDFSIIIQILSK